MDYLFCGGLQRVHIGVEREKFFPGVFWEKAWTPSHSIQILHEPSLGRATCMSLPPSVLFLCT